MQDKGKHFKICKNAEIKSFTADEIIYSNIINKNENYFLLKGNVNVYKRELNEENQVVNVRGIKLELFENIKRRCRIRTNII